MAETTGDQELMGHVARLFYLGGLTRVQIAQRLGISRFKTGRLLTAALESGVVTITLKPSALIASEVSDALAGRFGLRSAYAVRVDEGVDGEPDRDLLHERLGRVAAGVLSETVTKDDVLGLDSGRTVSHIADHLNRLPPCDVVQLTGLTGTVQQTGLEILGRITAISGGQAHPIYAPMITPDSDSADAMRRQPGIRSTTDYFRKVTRAVVSVGSWSPPDSQVYDRLPAAERTALVKSGVVAETCALMFDADGQALRGLDDRRIGISLQELRAVDHVIAVAGGTVKRRAITAMLRSRILDTLITDEATARALLAWQG
ncbi:sugar-binding domain-containing protein [Streptomyces shenzhenensis]|uniref:sugar-binding transcriptional regulator n=1 Tax=Streptomyces shenzhenensis TaxID=943815 RepID=UPI0033E1C855